MAPYSLPVTQKPNLIIAICLLSCFEQMKVHFAASNSCRWMEPAEVNEIINELLNVAISGTLKATSDRLGSIYKECQQGNIDYLQYRGFSIEEAFQASSKCESLVLQAIFDAFPQLDNTAHITIVDYRLDNYRDLIICTKLNHALPTTQTTNAFGNTNHSYSGPV